MKNSWLPAAQRLSGLTVPLLPRISNAIAVPPAVPLLRNSSRPVLLVPATNQSWPFQTTRSLGDDELAPGTRSSTICVPASVPSLLQSSVPAAVVVATNHSLPPKAINDVS